LASNCFSRREGNNSHRLSRSWGSEAALSNLSMISTVTPTVPSTTVRFESAVYVLHAFKKKSKRGIATPKIELDMIERRLRAAETDDAERLK
jgi:hypothetical protein